MENLRLASVKFKSAGKVYYFSTDLELEKGEYVVVETTRGLELGEISQGLMSIEEFNLDTELKSILRKATVKDIEIYKKNLIDAQEALVTCRDIIARYDVDMQLTNCEFTLDKAKVIGGIGTCGLPLCCTTLLGEFNGVSINMAKNQMLAINIEKISGSCGRLMCCLKYEDEVYSIEKQRFPKIGSKVRYEDKEVKVLGLNVINDLVKIDNNGAIIFVNLDEIKFKNGVSKNG